jgi:biotin carboxyl carrier protein
MPSSARRALCIAAALACCTRSALAFLAPAALQSTAPYSLVQQSRHAAVQQRSQQQQRQRIVMSAVQGKTHQITMPALSSTMTEGKIVQWLKEVGDEISVGEAVMVVESDKADMDVESFESGFLAAILTPEGEAAQVGAAVALIAENKDDIAAVAAGGGGSTAVSSQC